MTITELIEELRGGYLDDPHEAKRELARLDDLCQQAADKLYYYQIYAETLVTCLNLAGFPTGENNEIRNN